MQFEVIMLKVMAYGSSLA